MLRGDFNEVLNLGERSRERSMTASIRQFNGFVQRCHLIDLPMFERKFNLENSIAISGIDRCLVQNEWLVFHADSQL